MNKTIRQYIEEQNPPKPEGEYWYCQAGYEDAFHDCETLVWHEVGSYQGDFFVLVKGPDGRYGFTVIGYGSCSGCDALQAAEGYGKGREETLKGVADVLEDARNGVHWEDTKEAMHKYLTEECDKEMKLTYISDKEEKEKMWPKLLAAVSQ